MAKAPESEIAAGETVLGQTSYGKSDVRLVKVRRGTDRHELTDVRVDVALKGDFKAAHMRGDNTGLLATDTMRNTVYALAKDHLTGEIEEFGKKLVEHFLETGPTVEHVRIRFTEHLWDRIKVDGREHEHSFVRAAGERTATVEGAGSDVRIEAGIDDLLVLKTTNSGWEGFLRERYTTLPETDDRILSTLINADWTYYDGTDVDFGVVWRGVREQILVTLTDHYSPSVQNTLYRMGKAVLERFSEIEKIHLSLPNRHHIPYDLQRFGLENEGEIFHADPEPYGLIEGTVERRT
jgi:urate oxidase